MALNNELSAFYNNLHRTAPPQVSSTFKLSDKSMKTSFNRDKAVQPGSVLLDFSLEDSRGKTWTRDSLLNPSGLLISFYRGGWCPFCNIELRALQKVLPQLKAKGVTLVAISPDAPQESDKRREQMGLEFLMLSDPDNAFARQLGCVTGHPEAMRAVLEGVDSGWKDKSSLDVPVPATILIDGQGVVRETYINPAYHERLEPTVALQWIEKLQHR